MATYQLLSKTFNSSFQGLCLVRDKTAAPRDGRVLALDQAPLAHARTLLRAGMVASCDEIAHAAVPVEVGDWASRFRTTWNFVIYRTKTREIRECRVSQSAVPPPSTTSVAPVMNDESSEARKSTALAISSGVPTRPKGRFAHPALAYFGSITFSPVTWQK